MEVDVLRFHLFLFGIKIKQNEILTNVSTMGKGRFKYTKIAENIERKKEEYYWKNKTLCGTNEPKKKQFSLIKAYKEFIIPEMEKFN